MKSKNILSLAIIGLSMLACGKSHNDKMTELIMKKQALEDSIEYFKNIESVAQIKLDTVAYLDSTVLRDIIKIDTSLTDAQAEITIKNYYKNINRIEAKLKKVVNSLDSLEKMK